jgi:membrane protein DedA with SNARE-associated domain
LRRWVRNLLIVALLVFPIVVVSLTYLEDIAETSNQLASQGIVAFVSNLPRRVVDVAAQAGYAGIFALMLLEAAALPVPSEIILPFAGFMVSQRILDFWPVVIISTAAALIGSFIDYYVGWRLGPPLLANQSKIPFVDSAHLRRVGVWFDHYGPVAVALFRLVPAARVLISFPAGIYRMSKSRFAMYTLAGCLPWNVVLVYLGWWLGSSWEEVVAAFRYINLIVYVLLILFVVWVGWKLSAKRRKNT